MQDLNDKITGNNLTAAEWNQMPTEIQNIITAFGQSLSAVDLDQLGKAISGYVANGNFYTDSGTPNVYNLSSISGQQSFPEYQDGQLVIFLPDNNSTGVGTVTINISGLGNINCKDANGNDIAQDVINTNSLFAARYNDNAGEFRQESILTLQKEIELKSGRKNIITNGDFLINQSGFGPFDHNTATPAPDFYVRTSDQWNYTPILAGGTISNGSSQVIPHVLGQNFVPNNPRNYLEFSGNIIGGDTNETIQIQNTIRDVRQLSGQMVTYSFWLKGTVEEDISLVMTQNFDPSNGGSPSVQVFAENISIVSAGVWQKYTKTFLMPSIATKTIGSTGIDNIQIGIVPQLGATRAAGRGVAAVNYSGTLSLSDVQLEKGSFKTDFDRLEFQEAEIRAKRLFQRLSWGPSEPFATFTFNGGGTVRARAFIPLPVAMIGPVTISGSSQGAKQVGTIINEGNGSIFVFHSNILKAVLGNQAFNVLTMWYDNFGQLSAGDSAFMQNDAVGSTELILNLNAWF